MLNTHSISATVCTLNEEINIEDCIKSIKSCNPGEIIVVDASSDDSTAEIAEKLGARVIVVPRKGLAFQRNVAVNESRGNYVALFDADHRPKPDALKVLLDEIEKYDADGIEAQVLSKENSGYWDWAMEMNFKLTHNFIGPRTMIGTPCLYTRQTLISVPFDIFFTGPSDDTDLCYRLTKKGYKLYVGSAIVEQIHRSSFLEFYKKWIWYGTGDAQFYYKHPERIGSIIFHQLVRYPILKSLIALRHGMYLLPPFFIMAGLLRFVGGIKGTFLLILYGNKKIKIQKT